MKNLILILACAGLSAPVMAQQFIAEDTLRIENGREMNLRWTDWSGDQSPDLLVVNKRDTSFQVLLFVREFESWSPQILDISPAQSLFELADMNNDGLLDFIGVSQVGEVRNLVIELQRANGFESVPLTPADSLVGLAVFDLNQDGNKDIIASGVTGGENFNAMILLDSARLSQIVSFAPDTLFHHIEQGNFNDPARKSILLAGEYGLFEGIYHQDTLRWSQSIDSTVTTAIQADLLPDALDETLIITSDKPDSIQWKSPAVDSTFFLSGAASSLFSADLTSDGLTDIWEWKAEGTALVWSRENALDFAPVWSLPIRGSAYAFGDQENDGDLDLAVVSRENAELIHLFTNTADTNRGPSLAPYHVAFHINDKVVVAWDASSDDHTIKSQITYDVIIGKTPGDASLKSGSFDLDKARRMYWVRGNSGLQKEVTIRNLDEGIYSYGIQSLDNARFAVIPEGPGNGCEYPLPIALGAFEVRSDTPPITRIPYCNQDSITLSSSRFSGWYSVKNGYLGMSLDVRFKAIDGDTIYQKPVSYNTCDIRPVNPSVFVLDASENNFTSSVVYGCQDQILDLRIFPGGDSTRWTGRSFQGAGEGLEISHPLTRNDTLIAKTYFNGCVKTDSFYLFISKPDVQTDPGSVVIFKGNSVQLAASGAESYQWLPPLHLDNPLTDKPVATPPATILYTVVGRDSLTCPDSASVRIEVQDQAYIPNLFTPNGDQQNDRLLIYGLSPVSSFTFTIYNRNGTRVYSTSDPGEITGTGWDGSKNGEPQPDGVYYWKVEGRFDNDDPVMLNGKNEGVIHLMR